MRRLQLASKFKSSEFAVLTVVLLLNTSFLLAPAQAVFADDDSANGQTNTPVMNDSQAPDGMQSGSESPASSTSSAPTATTSTTELAPAQSPTLAPEQTPVEAAPSQSQQSPQSPQSNDLVMQTPQVAIDPAVASAYNNRLSKMEEIAFGASYPEHELNDRIDHLEEEIFKSKNSGAPDVRITKLETKVFGQSAFTQGSQTAASNLTKPATAPVQTQSQTSAQTPISSAGIPGNGGNTPPVIIPGTPSTQTPPAYTAPSYPVQPYQGNRPYNGGNNYQNQNYSGQGQPSNNQPAYNPYGYSGSYGGQSYQQYPPNNQSSYQYGGNQPPYAGQGYQQYQPYRNQSVQQSSLPQQPYTPYQQNPYQPPSSPYAAPQYPVNTANQYPSYPNSQYPNAQYPNSQYPANPQNPPPQSATPPDNSSTSSSKNSAACEKVASAIPQSAKDGDYFANLRHFPGNSSMHWQSFPVTVHLPKDSPDSWRKALDGDLKTWSQYVPLNAAKGDEKGKIDVQWVNKLPPKILGVTRVEGTADSLKVTIFVLRPTFYPSEIPENVLQKVFAHELGHAVGLLGHSTNSGDVMYIHDEKQDKTGKGVKSPLLGSDKPSGRDLNTLKKLYMSSPLPAGFKFDQPLEYSDI